MNHEHEDYNDCTICNTQAALCKYCQRDIRIGGGTFSKTERAICNTCKEIEK